MLFKYIYIHILKVGLGSCMDIWIEGCVLQLHMVAALHNIFIQCIIYQKWVLKKQYLEDREIMEHFNNNFKYSKNIRFWCTSLLHCHSSRVFITDHYSPTWCTVMTVISVFSQCWSFVYSVKIACSASALPTYKMFHQIKCAVYTVAF